MRREWVQGNQHTGYVRRCGHLYRTRHQELQCGRRHCRQRPSRRSFGDSVWQARASPARPWQKEGRKGKKTSFRTPLDHDDKDHTLQLFSCPRHKSSKKAFKTDESTASLRRGQPTKYGNQHARFKITGSIVGRDPLTIMVTENASCAAFVRPVPTVRVSTAYVRQVEMSSVTTSTR